MHKHNLSVTVTVHQDGNLKLPEDQVILLFQSVRELLINSSKHAGTGKAAAAMGATGSSRNGTRSRTADSMVRH